MHLVVLWSRTSFSCCTVLSTGEEIFLCGPTVFDQEIIQCGEERKRKIGLSAAVWHYNQDKARSQVCTRVASWSEFCHVLVCITAASPSLQINRARFVTRPQLVTRGLQLVTDNIEHWINMSDFIKKQEHPNRNKTHSPELSWSAAVVAEIVIIVDHIVIEITTLL